MRPFVVAANWKMNKSPREASDFLKGFLPKVGNKPRGREIILFVPAIDLMVVHDHLKNTGIGFGAQNCHYEASGAFTGENSPKVLAEIGVGYALVGHSERRTLFHETDDDTAKKVLALQQLNLTPMLCVGESLGEREASLTSEVIVRQLRAGFSRLDMSKEASKKILIAYEPVWAIGTGVVATPEQAQEAHLTLREALKEIGGEEFAKATPILYGGSVKADIAADLAIKPDIDGFLVGGASLEVSSFLPLCMVAKG